MNKRDFCKYTIASSIPSIHTTNAEAFLFPFLALLGRASLSFLARAAGTTRANSLMSAAGRAHFNHNPQFTVVPAGNTALLRPKLRISNSKTSQSYRSPTIHIREVNLTFNESRDITIQPMEFPAGYEGNHEVSLGNLMYRHGCDYIREIISVDDCGCEARWQPEALALLTSDGNVSSNPPTIFPFGSAVSCPQVPIGNGMARCQ